MNEKGQCKLYNRYYCDIPPSQCPTYKHRTAERINTHTDLTKIDNITTKAFCKYCFNARVYRPTDEELMDPFATELTDENDSSSCGVGNSVKDIRFMISSGYGEPLRIEIDKWSDSLHQWSTVGKYYPKYCPECGRRLDEYEKDNNNH